jgi:hypothetical protein
MRVANGSRANDTYSADLPDAREMRRLVRVF